jgi:hypothetical protein
MRELIFTQVYLEVNLDIHSFIGLTVCSRKHRRSSTGRSVRGTKKASPQSVYYIARGGRPTSRSCMHENACYRSTSNAVYIKNLV